MLQALRRYLRSDMTVLRWLLLVGYFGIIGAWTAISSIGYGAADLDAVLVVGVFLGLQAAFIWGAGTQQLSGPISWRRLLLPALITATLLTLLALGACVAILDAADANPDWEDSLAVILISAAAVVWAASLAVLLHFAAGCERRSAIWRLCAAVAIGCVIELVVAWSCFALAQDNGGFLAGIVSILAIMFGFLILFWILGPCIVFLFLRPRYRREKEEWSTHCQACGYDLRVQLAAPGSIDRCPECGTPIVEHEMGHRCRRSAASWLS